MVPKAIESAFITVRAIGQCDEFSIPGGAWTAPLFTQKSCYALQRGGCMRGILSEDPIDGPTGNYHGKAGLGASRFSDSHTDETLRMVNEFDKE